MNDRRCKAALACLLLAASSLASAALTVPLPWQPGLKVRYQSNSVQEKVRAGKHERMDTREVLALEITEASERGYLQLWRSEAPSVEVSGDADNIAAERAVAQQLVKRFAELPLQAELDAQGTYTGLRNWRELGAAMREIMLPILVQQAQARPELAKADEARLRGMLAPALRRLTSQQAINSTLGRQAAIYNFFTAPSLTPGKPATYQDSMPSPWSSDVIPTTGSFELIGVDDKAGTLSIRWRQSIDPVKGAAVVWKMVEALGGSAGQPPPVGLPEGLSLSDQATVVLERSTGLPLSLVHRREAAMAGNSVVTTWTLQRLAAP